MSDKDFQRRVRKAAAKAKQTQTAERVKAPAKKIPLWQGCFIVIVVGLMMCAGIAGLVYKVQLEPAVQTWEATTEGLVPTFEAKRIIGHLAAACFGYTNLTATRCDEKALAAWHEDEPTVRVCVGAHSDARGGQRMLDCVVERGLWD